MSSRVRMGMMARWRIRCWYEMRMGISGRGRLSHVSFLVTSCPLSDKLTLLFRVHARRSSITPSDEKVLRYHWPAGALYGSQDKAAVP